MGSSLFAAPVAPPRVHYRIVLSAAGIPIPPLFTHHSKGANHRWLDCSRSSNKTRSFGSLDTLSPGLIASVRLVQSKSVHWNLLETESEELFRSAR
jgi:hypothetical protein